ncbi:MAG: A24 family peptidase [Coxiellaceae bacterium]|nr:A24 family peptidase [Coxiellaceae bacterium]
MDSTYSYLLTSPYIYIFTAIISLAVGSFLNVVIYRYPLMLAKQWKREAECFLNDTPYTPDNSGFDLCKPRSRCPKCEHAITAWQNIPIISFILLRGRCAHCKTKISWRYPLIEALTAILSAIVVWQFGSTYLALFSVFLTWGLIAQSAIDIDQQFIPDNITYILLWLGLVISCGYGLIGPIDSIVGAVIGYLILWFIAKAFYIIRKKEGMGHGDFKMLAMFGAWVGPTQLPIILVLASVTSLVISIILLCNKRMQRDTPLPFGPFLAIGGWVSLLWGTDIMQAIIQFYI